MKNARNLIVDCIEFYGLYYAYPVPVSLVKCSAFIFWLYRLYSLHGVILVQRFNFVRNLFRFLR
jgi:hypothetical protein